MHPVTLAILWHQHQPYYPDDVSGETLFPWVRLHGTKSYIGMALHVKEVPEFRCTINLVPSLLTQIERYVHHNGSDRHLDISRIPADSLGETEIAYLLDNFFMANVDTMIRPFARYYELYQKRGFGTETAESAAPKFSTRDIRDLQIWSNLTWIHDLVFEHDAELRAFRDQGSGWSETDKRWLLQKQREILGQVIPLHAELARGGQIELTTTPFYHPILPLLWNKRAAREAMPKCALPQHLESYSEDARDHLRRAVEYHEKLFGERPVGMWPSEGSVSQEIIGAVAEAGIRWIATDEEVLSQSLGGSVSRDGHGHLHHPELLYRPWRVSDSGKELQIVFRDHAISDLVGFQYQRMEARHAASDMLGRILGIGEAVRSRYPNQPVLVPVILDGENCWEYYPDRGVEFLRNLYRNAAEYRGVIPARMRDYLDANPAADRIERLHAGSWIAHNFAIWIGHEEDNTAWDHLHAAREFLKQTELSRSAPPDAIERAWKEIFIAEGSDWYWWFGDDHSSSQDWLFDQAFRKHLQNVYTILGVESPSILNHPISRSAHRRIQSDPSSLLKVDVDGRRTFFEWIGAGHYQAGSERGTMTMTSAGLVRDIFFGFDAERFLLRVDTAGKVSQDLGRLDELRIVFLDPPHYEVRIGGFKDGSPKARLWTERGVAPKTDAEVAVDQILEFGVPTRELQLEPGARIAFYVEAFAGRQSVERVPHEGVLESIVPGAHFDRVMWRA